jgi:hypothetical protein
MNTKLFVWIGIVFLGVIVATVVWFFVFIPHTTPQHSQPSTGFPSSGTINITGPTDTIGSTSSPAVQTMTVADQKGNMIVMRDFINNGVTVHDVTNTGRYLLAGNLGYCVSDTKQCQATSQTDFNIYYNSGPQSFTIAFNKEPIGEVRLAMERFLLTTLGLTEQQLCNLNYFVGVPIDINQQYAGKNLGFSFCPGATILPK